MTPLSPPSTEAIFCSLWEEICCLWWSIHTAGHTASAEFSLAVISLLCSSPRRLPFPSSCHHVVCYCCEHQSWEGVQVGQTVTQGQSLSSESLIRQSVPKLSRKKQTQKQHRGKLAYCLLCSMYSTLLNIYFKRNENEVVRDRSTVCSVDVLLFKVTMNLKFTILFFFFFFDEMLQYLLCRH